MEEDGGGCGDDVNNACVAYDDRANENAMKASPDGGVQDERAYLSTARSQSHQIVTRDRLFANESGPIKHNMRGLLNRCHLKMLE